MSQSHRVDGIMIKSCGSFTKKGEKCATFSRAFVDIPRAVRYKCWPTSKKSVSGPFLSALHLYIRLKLKKFRLHSKTHGTAQHGTARHGTAHTSRYIEVYLYRGRINGKLFCGFFSIEKSKNTKKNLIFNSLQILCCDVVLRKKNGAKNVMFFFWREEIIRAMKQRGVGWII